MISYKKISLYVSSLAALLIFVGCGPSGDSFRFNGSIDGMETGEIYIFNTLDDNARFDTLRIESGKFHYGGVAAEPTPYIILFPNALEQVVFIGPGDEVEYDAVSSALNNYKASGNEENKLMNQFRSDIQNASYSDTQAKARRFMSEHAESVVSLYLFERYFVHNAQTTYKELTEVLEMLRPVHKDQPYFMTLEAQVKAIKGLNIGDTFPDVKLPGVEGKKTALWSTNDSQLTLFLCWTTWITSSYEFMSKLRQASNDNTKSQLRIVAFSIDNEYDRWRNMTRFDSLTTIEHYCDPRAFDSKPFKQIGASEVPTYFLIDKKHKIVAKGTQASQLSEDLSKNINK